MPTTRRSTGGTRARPGPGKGQSTNSFSNKVVKNVPQDVKKSIIADSPLKSVVVPEPEEEVAPDVTADEESDQEQEVEESPAPTKSAAEIQAEKISDAQISRYWKKIEAERIAPRVHQQELDVSEKVLRYFDVSSQYGPCIGIERIKRWQRAERLGLKPPIEVLAVLLKQEARGNKEAERAHIDYILNSTAIGA